MCGIISNIPSNSAGNTQVKNSIENQIMEELKIDYFSILAKVLKKHDKIKGIRDFITGIF